MKLYCPGTVFVVHMRIFQQGSLLDCRTSYQHNYYVQNSLRFYYGGDDLPEVVEVAEHHFIERKIINLWRIDMNVAWYVVFF